MWKNDKIYKYIKIANKIGVWKIMIYNHVKKI